MHTRIIIIKLVGRSSDNRWSTAFLSKFLFKATCSHSIQVLVIIIFLVAIAQ